MATSHGMMGHAPPSADTRALAISGWLTGIYFFIELGIGLWTGSVAVTSDAFHTFSAVGSLIIVASALVIRYTGFLLIDPLLGMLFGLVLFWASWRIIRGSLHILLQGTPEDLDLNAVLGAIHRIDGVTNVHHIHAWSLTSGRNVFSGHICVRDYREGERIQRAVHDLLKDRFGIYFSTIQIEEQCQDRAEATEIDITQGTHREEG